MNEDTGIDRGHASQIAAVPAFSLEACFLLGWAVLRSNYGLLLGVGVVALLITIAAYSLASAVLVAGNPVLQWIFDIFFAPVLATGVAYMSVRMARGETPEFGDMTAGFRFYWPIVGIAFVLKIIGLLIVVPSFLVLVSGFFLNFGIGFVLLFICTTLLSALILGRLSFAMVIYMDDWTGQPTIMECIAASWRMTGDWRWVSLLVLWIAVGLIYMVSFLLLVLPVLFFALPFSMAVWGCTYAMLAPKSQLIAAEYSGVCWNCSQPTVGLPTTTCPECGRDFTKPGSVF